MTFTIHTVSRDGKRTKANAHAYTQSRGGEDQPLASARAGGTGTAPNGTHKRTRRGTRGRGRRTKGPHNSNNTKKEQLPPPHMHGFMMHPHHLPPHMYSAPPQQQQQQPYMMPPYYYAPPPGPGLELEPPHYNAPMHHAPYQYDDPGSHHAYNNRFSSPMPPVMVDPYTLPVTPSIAQMTPKSQQVTIGEIILARAFVASITGEFDTAPLSTKDITPHTEAQVEAHVEHEDYYDDVSSEDSSPRGVNSTKAIDETQQRAASATATPLESDASWPNPQPQSKRTVQFAPAVTEEDLHRITTVLCNRRAQHTPRTRVREMQNDAQWRPSLPEQARHIDRFSTAYQTPGGQAISFKHTSVNTPPTPKYGGHHRVPTDVKWGHYEAVFPVRSHQHSNSNAPWSVTPRGRGGGGGFSHPRAINRQQTQTQPQRRPW